MKRQKVLFLLVTIFFCFANKLIAQTERGNYTLGGTAGFSRQTTTGGFSSSALNFNPIYGYFIYDRILLGAQMNLSFTGGGGGRRGGGLGLKAGPLMRYYFKNNLFVQGDYSVGFANRNIENDFYLRFGYAFFLNNFVSIEPYIYYGLQNLNARPGRRGFNYFNTAPMNQWNSDYGIYFSVQVYLESAFNIRFKNKKGILKPKEKGSQ